ncbi:hypothetical protein BST61_g1492 [Cercospora zeina]
MSKVIILTGASRGIGLAIAHFLLQKSHKLTLVARSKAALRELEKQYPNQTAILPGDFSDLSLGQQAVDLTVEQFGRLDGVIVNHGVLDPVMKVADANAEEWRAGFTINFFSAVAIAKAAIPHLRESKGRIIFTSSGAASYSYQTWGAYGSSKAAVNHLAGSIGNEEKDIVSISVRPGVVDTEMQKDIREKHHTVMDATDRAKFKELKDGGLLLKPEQPGNVIARLVLDAPKELSGAFVSWDGEEVKAFQD